MSIALGGFYLASRNGWEPLLFCLLGFITARLIVFGFTRSIATIHVPQTETGNAS